MKNLMDLPYELEKYGPEMSGVFMRSDLANLFGNINGITLSSRISRLVKSGYITQAIRGIYYSEYAKLEDIALRIFPDGYLSLTTALSMHGLIGNSPSRTVNVITSRPRPKTFRMPLGVIRMNVKSDAYIPVTEIINGLNVASKEQAVVDSCYFAFRGLKLPFDLYSDVNISMIDKTIALEMLSKYKNTRFQKFSTTVLQDDE